MYGEANQIAKDAVGSIRTIASFCAEEKVMELYKKKCEGPAKSGIRQGLVVGLVTVFLTSCCFASMQLVSILVFFALTMAAIGISQTSSYAPDSAKAKASTASIFALLDRKSKIDTSDESDGIELQKFQSRWLRQQMGLVSQEPVLFNDTIRANIAYGKEGNATEAEILATAELANAHESISGLQQGYDTIVGERGVQLSGGQKQRVEIARAIMKGPKILLLDEATSALDAESERVVQDALNRVMMYRTTIMVAHWLSTIKNADRIAVVKNGVIAEEGKHDTLINTPDELYASLVALHMSSSS
ncbi:hypothetical protein GIB67_024975 [Kingdonia uniflora]|uniref:Uncharacterized protein n=1 Tax=Kingdonia uniflora TaxID=39325 RepID=A0A7J7NZ57_9MAGN|nr:hypothetical protein GIB67_024975 [Kingdonia uniflora]